jgi:hypothetical protein
MTSKEIGQEANAFLANIYGPFMEKVFDMAP